MVNLSPVPSPNKGRGTKQKAFPFRSPLLLRRGDRGEVQEQQGIISNIYKIINPTETLCGQE